MKIRKPNRVTTPRRAVRNGTRTSHSSMPRTRSRWWPGPARNRASAPGDDEPRGQSRGEPAPGSTGRE